MKSNKNKQSGSVATRLTAIIIIVLFIASGGIFYLLYHGSGGGDVCDVIIPRKASLGHVAEILHQQGVIDQPGLLKTLMRVTQGSSHVRAGEFRFRKDMRTIDALLVLYYGEPIVHQITFPEGWTVRQMAAILSAEKLVDEKKFLDLTLGPKAAAKYHLPSPTLEGFLYPNTYTFSKIDGEERIVDTMVRQFMQIYDRELKAEAEQKGMSLLTLVTLASIVEKETGVNGERELVSSVFHNRLKKKMRLQSDPTTIYGIPDFNGNLTRADLRRFTPYNTYTIPGLPPGPIANPGLAAMKATLNPADTKYLYFVANNKGQHVFSETYEQHSRKVTTFQVLPYRHK